MSQPSLSTAIQKFEDELGGALFSRNGRNISLTPLGESMRLHLSRIEQAREAAFVAASDIVSSDSRPINVGLMCTLSPRALLNAISSFHSISNSTELLIHDIWQSKALELLLSGSLDCMLMAHPDELPSRFIVQHLADEPMVLAMHRSHPLARQDSIGFSELAGLPYIDRLRCEFRSLFFKELNMRSLNVKVVLQSEREDIVVESISEAIGVSVMPKSVAINSELHTCVIRDLPAVRRISLVTVKERQLHAEVTQFVEHIYNAYQTNELSVAKTSSE